MNVLGKLEHHGEALCEAVNDFAANLTTTRPALGQAARSALGDLADPRSLRARLFPVLALGAASGSGGHAVPAAVVSSLWWSGFERLGLAHSLHAVHRAMAAMTVLPLQYIDSLQGKVRMRRYWSEAVTTSSSYALSRVLTAESPAPTVVTREFALGQHFATFGAAYARDAQMAAAAAPGVAMDRWRQFGHLYGLLMGIADDNSRDVDRPGAQAGNPPVLLLAHAFGAAGANSDHLARLRMESPIKPMSRAALNELAHSRAAVRSYNRDVDALKCRVTGMLEEVAAPGPYRTLIEESITAAAGTAMTKPREIVGLDPAPAGRLIAG